MKLDMNGPRAMSFATLLLAAWVSAGCEAERPVDAPVAWPVGRWVRVYPVAGAPDTIEFRADQTMRGSSVGWPDMEYELERWKLGDPGMPSGLCMGEGDTPDGKLHRWYCVGYKVSGDTLWLANLTRTVLLRLPADGRTLDVTPWADARGDATTPRAGAAVPDSSFRVPR